MNREELLNKLAGAISEGEEQEASAVAQDIITAGIDHIEAILQGATKGLDVVGV